MQGGRAVFSVGGGRIISFAAGNVASSHSSYVASRGGGIMVGGRGEQLTAGESKGKSAMKVGDLFVASKSFVLVA